MKFIVFVYQATGYFLSGSDLNKVEKREIDVIWPITDYERQKIKSYSKNTRPMRPELRIDYLQKSKKRIDTSVKRKEQSPPTIENLFKTFKSNILLRSVQIITTTNSRGLQFKESM